MEKVTTTKMSSKGQVVIPETIRKKLNLVSGTHFIVLGDNDTVILQKITMPNIKEFNAIIARAKQQAKSAGLTHENIETAIASVRG